MQVEKHTLDHSSVDRTLKRISTSVWHAELQDSHWSYLKPTPDNIELLLEALNVRV